MATIRMSAQRDPLVRRDLRELARHVAEVSGDALAAVRRLDQVDALLRDILSNPGSGTRMNDTLPGWRVRHGGTGQKITIVFRLAESGDRLRTPLVAFGGRADPDRRRCVPVGRIPHGARIPADR